MGWVQQGSIEIRVLTLQRCVGEVILFFQDHFKCSKDHVNIADDTTRVEGGYVYDL